jgi:HAD superfamily hydrolase (TIGR01549 family)
MDMNREIEAIFIDLGNTLRISTQNEEHQNSAKLKIVKLISTDLDPDRFMEMIDERYKVYRKWAFENKREAPESELWTRWLVPDFPPEQIAPLGAELTYQYRQYMGLRVLVENGQHVVETLFNRGYTLGIISNLIGTREIPEWLEKDGLTSYFKSIALSSVLGIRKPAPEIYLEAARQAGVEPSRCAYVGDNLKRDITGTHAAGFGMSVIVYSPEKFAQAVITDENKPDIIIQKFEDLLILFPKCPKVTLNGF